MQTVKCCSLHIPLLFGWQSCLQHSFKQRNSMYDGLFPPDPEGTAFTQAWLTPHGGEYPRYTVFPSTNTNKHQHPPHLRCLLEEWFHLQSLVSPGQSSSCHLAPSFVSWCGSRSSRCSGGARGWSAISSGCWSSAWGPESSGWSWGMAGVVSWPLSQTCPRCHWKRLNTRLQENGAGESSFQHSSAPRGTTGARSTEPALGKGFVTYGLYANFIAHQREEYALLWAFPTISHTSLISYHTICPYERSQMVKFF